VYLDRPGCQDVLQRIGKALYSLLHVKLTLNQVPEQKVYEFSESDLPLGRSPCPRHLLRSSSTNSS